MQSTFLCEESHLVWVMSASAMEDSIEMANLV